MTKPKLLDQVRINLNNKRKLGITINRGKLELRANFEVDMQNKHVASLIYMKLGKPNLPIFSNRCTQLF